MRNVVEIVKSWGKYITSPFGWRDGGGGTSGDTTYKPGMHRGVDIGGFARGESFLSPFDGVVSAVRTSGMGTWGNTVCVSLDPPGSGYTMLTAHHEKIHVKEGQRVKQGDPLAVVGGTTHTGVTYARHVHLEIQEDTGDRPWRGTPIDPATFWIDQAPAEPSIRFSTGNIIVNNNANRINIRESPGVHHRVVGQVGPGEDVQIKEHADNGIKAGLYHWWFIGSGWIAEDFFDLLLFPDPEPVTPPEIEDPEEAYPVEPVEEEQKEQPEPPAGENYIELVALMKLLIKKLSLFLELLGIERGDEK